MSIPDYSATELKSQDDIVSLSSARPSTFTAEDELDFVSRRKKVRRCGKFIMYLGYFIMISRFLGMVRTAFDCGVKIMRNKG